MEVGIENLAGSYQPPPCTPSHYSRGLAVENTLLEAQSDLQAAPTLTQDAEGGRKSLYAGKFAGSAIVHRVSSHQVRQQPNVAPPHLPKWRLMQSGPGTVDDSHPRLCNQLSTRSSRRTGSGGQHHPNNPQGPLPVKLLRQLGKWGCF